MNKKNTILLIIFLVLLGLALLYKGPFTNYRLNKQKEPSFLSGLDLDKINQIEIAQPEKERISLTKSEFKGEERWKISIWPGFYVSRLNMKEIFEKLAELSQNDLLLASNEKDRKDRFMTNNEEGIWVELFNQEDVLASMIVGKNTRDYNYTYFSQPGADQTYMAKGNMYGMFVKTEWRDQSIFDDDQDLVDTLRIQRGADSFLIEEKDGKWFYNEIELNENKVAQITRSMTSLNTARFPEQTFAGTGLEKNQLILQVTGEGVDNTLMIGDYIIENLGDLETATEDKYYYVKRGDSDNIYMLHEKTINTFDVRIEDLKKEEKK
ncbi:MAG: DUF4340 domain-containing protein [bacterium]